MKHRILRRLEEYAAILEAEGFDMVSLRIGPPATEAQLEACEQAIGQALPPSLRCWFAEQSGSVAFTWFTDSGHGLPPALARAGDSGRMDLSLTGVVGAEENRRLAAEGAFDDPDIPYARAWHGKLGLLSVDNGDVVAMDESWAVVYLGHDGSEEDQARQMGPDFDTFLDAWTRLLCVGPEDWNWSLFHDPVKGCLDADSALAIAFREFMGVA